MGHQINVVYGKIDPKHLPTRVPPWFHLDERVKLIFVDESNTDDLPDGDAVFSNEKRLPPEKGHPFTLIQGYGVFDKSLDDGLFKTPTKKICVSRWLLEKGLELGVPPEELVHIPNGIGHQQYKLFVPIEPRPRRIAMHYVHD